LPRPLAVAITGGVGAGKSEALKAFARLGAATISSDEIVHRLLREDGEVRNAIVGRWGDRALDDAGQVDRQAIAKVVFADREELGWLEGLLHPRVVREYLAWREELGALAAPPAVCVTEVPLLYEVGGESRFDAVVALTAPRKLREARGRVVADDREQRLVPEKEKLERADFSYVNTGTVEELEEFVRGVMGALEARVSPAS
jgi:dephospho-CoA kinase